MVVSYKRITLQRFLHSRVTFGKMNCEWVKNQKDIYTIELPWNNNQTGISCIPQGIYNCMLHNSPNHPNTWQILNVPSRDNILIHPANYACDIYDKDGVVLHRNELEGCIAPGLGIDEDVPMVTRSMDAVAYLHDLIGGDNFSIEVKD